MTDVPIVLYNVPPRTACDLKPERLDALRNLPCDLVVMDGETPLPFRRVFDRILLDASPGYVGAPRATAATARSGWRSAGTTT